MSVGKKIARWRAARGLSERAAAALAHVSQPTWRSVERDEMKRIGLDVAWRIVRACGGVVTLDDFLPPHRRNRFAA